MPRLAIFSSLAVRVVLRFGKDSKRPFLPDPALNAKTVAVRITPEAGESLTGEQQQARLAVERELRKWGRFMLAPYTVEVPRPADLISEIHKGGGLKQTIHGGRERGATPDVTDITTTVGVSVGSPRTEPHPQTEYSSPEDEFKAYLPMAFSAAVVFRYSGKNALEPPAVRAAYGFRKAVTDSEAARKGSAP